MRRTAGLLLAMAVGCVTQDDPMPLADEEIVAARIETLVLMRMAAFISCSFGGGDLVLTDREGTEHTYDFTVLDFDEGITLGMGFETGDLDIDLSDVRGEVTGEAVRPPFVGTRWAIAAGVGGASRTLRNGAGAKIDCDGTFVLGANVGWEEAAFDFKVRGEKKDAAQETP